MQMECTALVLGIMVRDQGGEKRELVIVVDVGSDMLYICLVRVLADIHGLRATVNVSAVDASEGVGSPAMVDSRRV